MAENECSNRLRHFFDRSRRFPKKAFFSVKMEVFFKSLSGKKSDHHYEEDISP